MRKFPKLKFDVILGMQIKFVAVAMAILILVFLVMLSSINMMMNTVSQSQSHRLLVQIAESDRYNTLASSDEFVQGEPPVPPDAAAERDDVIDVQQLAYRNWWEDDNGWEDDWRETRETREEPPEPPMPPSEEERPTQPIWPPETMPPPETALPSTAAPTAPTAPTTLPPVTDPYVPPQTQAQPDPTVQAETTTVTETTVTSASTTTTQTTTQTTTRPEPPPKLDKWNVTITIDHFALLVGHNGEFLGLRNTQDYTAEQAEEIMHGILKTGDTDGMYGWLQYYMAPKEYGTLIVVTDKTSDQGLLNNLFRITVIVGCLMLILLLAILCVLSKWITKPVETAFARQKQFVSDAGHELKTPLTVLSANADILQDEIGENKWLGYMQEQTGRMNQLVGDLLRLARMDNATQEYNLENFNLSAAINATALPFESQAFELHKNLELDIQQGVEYCGSEQHIRQLAAIFIDNAMKYSNENGIIKVTLLKRGDKCILEFYNTGCEISPEETRKIFERFYRGDKARKNQGKSGYGLGLAIAKSIMDIHKIKVQVTCEQGRWIRFLLTM